jgi:Raf kinase inhibitor-like YbhB/YbcL family protein
VSRGTVILLTTACLAGAALALAAAPQKGGRVSLQVSSKAFSAGGTVPKRNTCDGENLSPPLAWSETPSGARSIALIADDPDAPGGTFTHWLVFNLAPQTQSLPEGASASLPGGGIQGRNGFGKVGYGGPCPPPGKPHRYFFRVFALDNTLQLKAGASREEIEKAMQGHVLAQGEIMARYGR